MGVCVHSHVGGAHYTHVQLESLWIKHGGAPKHADVAAAVAEAESSGYADSYCVNTDGSTDRGLWQINSSHGKLSTFNVDGNAAAAVAISSGGTNWKPWTTYVSGAYKKYLTGKPPPTGITPTPAPSTPQAQPAGTPNVTPAPTAATGFTSDWWKPGNYADLIADTFDNMVGGANEMAHLSGKLWDRFAKISDVDWQQPGERVTSK